MGWFSALMPASPQVPCANCCRKDRAGDDALSRSAASRMQVLMRQPVPENAPAGTPPPTPRPNPTPCEQEACTLAPTLQRFNRYREALPYARAAADLNELGDAPGDTPSTKPCLARLPVQAAPLNAALGLPQGTVKPEDLRNDATGFRAAMYRDETTGKLILVPRDTQPDSLVDWKTNIENGAGLDTKQYQAGRRLTTELQGGGVNFDLAGYSKGAGIAQEMGLMTNGQVRIFNSAGLTTASLGRSGQTDFTSLAARTKAFSADGEFLTFMTETSDPVQQIRNAQFLRDELAGQGSGYNPIKITTLNPASRGQPNGEDFTKARDELLGGIGRTIASMQADLDAGRQVTGFPPVRAGTKEEVVGSADFMATRLGAAKAQPNLGKLMQHRMSRVLDPMEDSVKKDRQALQRFLSECG